MPLCLARRTSSKEEWVATNRLEAMVEVCLSVLFLCCPHTFYKVVAFVDLIVTTASFLGLYSCSCYWLLTISKVIIGRH